MASHVLTGSEANRGYKSTPYMLHGTPTTGEKKNKDDLRPETPWGESLTTPAGGDTKAITCAVTNKIEK